MNETKVNETVKSLGKAFEIIEFLATNRKEAGITEIAKSIGASNSTVFRQLNTLKDMGYIFKNPQNSKYWLGLKFYMLGNLVKHNLPLVNLMAEKADEIGRKYKQTIYIAIPDYSSEICAQQAIIYKKSFSSVVFRHEAVVGTVSPSHGAATGKCMMAYYNESHMKHYREHQLVKMTSRTIGDWETMNREMELIRARGYAMDSEEEEDKKTCIAVPILDSYKRIIASVSLSGSTEEILTHPISEIVKDLESVGEIVSKEI